MEHLDFGVSLALLLTILSTLLCVYYGLTNWNKDKNEKQDAKVKQWAKTEDKIDKDL